MKAKDLAGQRFGRLVALKPTEDRRRAGDGCVLWKCRCDCGARIRVASGGLRNGGVRSCGCYKREKTILTNQARRAFPRQAYELSSRRRQVVYVGDAYVRGLLRNSGVRNEDITPDIMNLKRQQVILQRNTKQLKRRLENEPNHQDT